MLQPLHWLCVDCVIHHERDVHEEQQYLYVARTRNNRVISSGELYCCLLLQCEALRTCRSGFPIATTAPVNFHKTLREAVPRLTIAVTKPSYSLTLDLYFHECTLWVSNSYFLHYRLHRHSVFLAG